METTKNINKKPDVAILMLGLDEAGKTTLLYRLKLGDDGDLKTIPTHGYNVETVEFEDKNFTFWDVGGLDTVRVLWKFFAENKGAVVFVVDVSNPARFCEAKDFLHTIMAHEALAQAALLILSNKQDKMNCVTNDELRENLNLKSLKQPIDIVNTSAYDRHSLTNIMIHLRKLNLFDKLNIE